MSRENFLFNTNSFEIKDYAKKSVNSKKINRKEINKLCHFITN